MKNDKNGWLDRKGILHKCLFNQHNNKVCELMKKLKLCATPEVLGWIKIHDAGLAFFSANTYCGQGHKKPTQLQYRWCRRYEYEMLD